MRTPRLLQPAVDALGDSNQNARAPSWMRTFRRGGHSRLILERLGPRPADRDGPGSGGDRCCPEIRDPRFAPVTTRASANCRQRRRAHAGGADGVCSIWVCPRRSSTTRGAGFSFRVDAPLESHGPDAG